MATTPNFDQIEYLDLDQTVDVTQTASLQPNATASEPEYLDIDTAPAVIADTPSTDPEVVKERADKLEYALGAGSPGRDVIENQLAQGDEPYLRDAMATSKALADRKHRLGLVQEATAKIDRPLTVEEADELMRLVGTDADRDPKTILEELYGEKLAEGVPEAIKRATGKPLDPSAAETYMDGATAVAKHSARTQIARSVLQDAEKQWKDAGIWDTGTAWAKQVVPFWSYSNLVGAVDQAKTESVFSFGGAIEEEIQYLYTLRPSEFRKQLTAAVNKIAEDSPLDAYLFAQGVLNYSPNDQALDNTFGAMDMTSFLPFARGAKAGSVAARAVDPVVEVGEAIQAKAAAATAAKTSTGPLQAVGQPGVFDQPVKTLVETPGVTITWDGARNEFKATTTASGKEAFVASETKGTRVPSRLTREQIFERYKGTNKEYLKAMPEEFANDVDKVDRFVRDYHVVKKNIIADEIPTYIESQVDSFYYGWTKEMDEVDGRTIRAKYFPGEGKGKPDKLFQELGKLTQDRIEVGVKKGLDLEKMLSGHRAAIEEVMSEIDDTLGSLRELNEDTFAKVIREKLTVQNYMSKYQYGKKGKYEDIDGRYQDFVEEVGVLRARQSVNQFAIKQEPFNVSPTLTIKLDPERIARDVTTEMAKRPTSERMQDFFGKKRQSLYDYLTHLGVKKSILSSPSFTAEATYNDVKRIMGSRQIPDNVKALAEGFLNESFDPWPRYRWAPDGAKAIWAPNDTFEINRAMVLVDPKTVERSGQRIARGKHFYPGAERLPAWLSGDYNALMELVLWHETAHIALKGRTSLPVEIEENLVNALALTKLFQYRVKTPGVKFGKTVTQDQPTQTPVPYVLKASVTPNEPRELAVVYSDIPAKGKIAPYTSYDPSTRILTVNKAALEKQWERKPWANSKTKSVAPIGTNADFATPQDWVDFSVAKAKLKALMPKPLGRAYAEHENYLNDLALKEVRVAKATQGTVTMNIMKDTVRASSETMGIERDARMGKTEKAVTDSVYKQVIDDFTNRDPLDDSMVLRKRTVSLFNVDQLGDAATSLTRERADRVLSNLRANAVRLLGIPLNNAAIVRLPKEAMEKAIEEAKKSLLDSYDRVNDAFLDVSLGGPWGLTRPEDQLVNSTVVHLKLGSPDGKLFDTPTRAAVYASDQYGLSANQFNILQQGEGFYINIAKNVDETLDSVRNLIVQTNNQSTRGFLGAFLGFLRTSDDLVSQMANENRMLATTASQEVHRILIESAQTIGKDLTKAERSQLQAIWERNRDFEYEDFDHAGNTVEKRGKFHETLQEFEDAFHDRFRQLPTEKQTEAYFTYVQLNDIDYILRNLALHRDMARIGAEKMHVYYDAYDAAAGVAVSKSSRGFAGKVVERLPLQDQSEDFGVWMYDPANKKGEYFLRSQITPGVEEEINKALNERGFKVVEVVNPLEKPLMEAAGTSDTINFMVVKNFENTKFDWAILPRQPGGHLEYGDQFFVKQPRIRRSQGSGSLRHIYEGDTSLLNAATQAEAEKYAKVAETARQLLRDGKEAELAKYLEHNAPWNLDTFKSFFKEKEVAPGVYKPALLHMDDPITWTYTGRNTSDMDHFKGAFGNYANFHNGVRSKYNLFAQGVDKKYLGSRDPDLPRVEELGTENKPLHKLAKPRLLSPLDTLNKALANVSRSRHMNDYKTSAVESFIEEFHTVMKLPDGGVAELRRNPIYYFHNPPWDTETTNKALLAAGQNAHRAHTYFIGTESELGSKLWWAQSKIADTIYKKLGQKTSNIVTEKYLPTVKDPFTYARSIAFHSKLGLFNPVQLFLQAQSFVHVLAIAGPEQGGKSAMNAIRMRQLALTENEKIIDQYARWSGDAKLFRESYKELKATGYYNVGGEVAWRDDVFDPDLFQGPLGTFLEKGTFFFKEGERFVRLSAWDAAFSAWRKANPKAEVTNAVRNQILKRADLMAVNMTRASNAAWQQGLFSIPTQFLSFQARLAEQMLPGYSSRLTKQEKIRAFATYSAMYGVPIGAGAATMIYPYHEDIRQAALERGINLDNRVLQLFNEGIIDTVFSSVTGKEYNISERYGPKGTNIFKEIVNGDMAMTEFLMGASGSIIGDMITSAEPLTRSLLSLFTPEVDGPTMDDFMGVIDEVSTINNAFKAWYMYNQGRYFTKSGSTVIDNTTAFDAFMQAVAGVTPEGATDTFVMIKSRKEQREAEQAAEKEVIKYYRKAIREYNQGNNDLGDTFMKRGKAWLISSGIRPSEYGKILNNAIKGNETLFNAVREDFWRKAPTDQTEARKQMIQDTNK